MTLKTRAEDNSQISGLDHELDLVWSLHRGSKTGGK